MRRTDLKKDSQTPVVDRAQLVSGSAARCDILLDRDSYLFPEERMVRLHYLTHLHWSLVFQGQFNRAKPFEGILIDAVIKHSFFSPGSLNSKLVAKCITEFTSSLKDAPCELEIPSYFVAVAATIVCPQHFLFLSVF
jgi:hypothetical protein